MAQGIGAYSGVTCSGTVFGTCYILDLQTECSAPILQNCFKLQTVRTNMCHYIRLFSNVYLDERELYEHFSNAVLLNTPILKSTMKLVAGFRWVKYARHKLVSRDA